MTGQQDRISLTRTIIGSLVMIVGTLGVVGGLLTLYLTMQHYSLSNEEFQTRFARPDLNGNFVAIAIILQFVVTLPLLFISLKFRNEINLIKFFGLTLPSKRHALLWAGILVIAVGISTIVTKLSGQPITPDFLIQTYKTSSPTWLFVLAVGILAPVWEEFLFRGFLFSGIRSTAAGTAGAVILTSILFAVSHTQYGVFIMFEIFIFSILICLSRLHTGSLWVPVGLHSAYNLLAIVVVANSDLFLFK